MLVVICVKCPAFGRYIITDTSTVIILFLTKESFLMSIVVILCIVFLHTSNVNNFQLIFVLLLETSRFSFSKRLIIYKSKVSLLTEMGKTTK